MRRLNAVIYVGIFVLHAMAQTADYPLETVIQTGQHGILRSLDFSPDGSYLVTGGTTEDVKVWEVSSGREIRSFQGLTKEIESVDYHPGGGLIAAALAEDESVIIWDVRNGNEVAHFKLDNWVTSVQFSPDGTHILIGGHEDNAVLYNIETKQKTKVFEGHSDWVNAVDISDDSRYLLTGSRDHTTKIWNFSTGQEIRTLTGHTGEVTSVCFSPDGKYILTGSEDRTAKLWKVSSGRELHTFREHTHVVSSVDFSPDGSYLVTGGYDELVVVWDISSRNEVIRFQDFSWVNDVKFTLDGQHVAAVNWRAVTTLWNLQTGEKVQVFEGRSKRPITTVFSPDGNYILTGSARDNAVRRWDLRAGRLSVFGGGHSNTVNSIAVSGNSRYIVTGSFDETAKIWDYSTGSEIHVLEGHSGPIEDIDFSPDSRLVITANNDTSVTLWDAVSGREIRRFRGHMDEINAISYSPDLKLIATGSDDKTVIVWDARDGREIRTLRGHTSLIVSVCYSPDGRYILTGSWDKTAKLWDVSTGTEVRTFTGHTNNIDAVSFSPDGNSILTGGWDRTAILWDVHTGRVLRRFTGRKGIIQTVCFSPDGRYVLLASNDSVVALYETDTGKEVVDLIAVDESDWVVMTPDGCFDCSEGAKKSIHFVKGLEIYELDQFFEDFYRPGLLAEVLWGENKAQPDISVAEKLNQSPPPSVEIVSPSVGQTFDRKEIEVRVRCVDNGGGIEDIRLYHNDKLVGGETRGVKIVSQDDEKSFVVNLLNGENRLKATAFSEGRIEARPFEIFVNLKGLEAEANSHILIIGIDQYRNSIYNLNYARADATSVKELIQNKSRGLFQDIIVHELFDDRATAEAIQSAFQTVIAGAQPQDVFTFFYAGHGVMLPDASGKEQFYLIPTEVTNMYDEDRVHASGISGSALVDFSKNILAQKQLFIIDACQAGSLSEMFALRGAAEQKALAQLARSAGVHVVASTGSEQFAAEFSELGHGLFTHALIQAVQGAADGTPKDGRVTVREINAYLENVIPDLSEKYRGQPQYPVVFSKGQDFPVVME